ncbi:MAG TPA: CHAT domain-containing protein [Kofleriaceae bacterium]|nr:CHAT domain-containing protein [Kofleriaceae bacterium]
MSEVLFLCREAGRVHALVDGELDLAERDEVRTHLAGCAICQQELAEAMQMAALESAARKVKLEPAATVPRARWRRGVSLAGAGLAAAAMAAAAWLVLPRVDPPPDRAAGSGAKVALAPSRGIEARLTWGPAATHRPYDVARAGDDGSQRLPLALLAELEARGDLQGIGALYLLAGDARQAARYLASGQGADSASDRAALELARGNPEVALSAAGAVLERQPDHAAARWNRALALRELGLLRSSAEDLRALAGRGEPGWSAEATARAAALEREADARAALTDRMLAGGPDLVQGGPGFSLDDARAAPGLARLFLYDAIRTAPTRERVLALRPLAAVLDEIASPGDPGILARAVERASAARFSVRGPLARRYAELAAGTPLAPAARARYLAALRAARQHDILIGALVRLGAERGTADESDIPELVRLARASGDPWFELLAAEQEARVRATRGDLLAAESVLLRARETCRITAIPYRCVKLDAQLVDIYATLHRFDEARRVLAGGWAAAAGSGGWILEQELLPRFVDLHGLNDDALGSGLPLMRAYAGEMVLRNPDQCGHRVWTHVRTAMVLVNQLRMDDARREMAAARPPGQPCAEAGGDLLSVLVGAHLLRESGSAAEVAALRADIARLRASTPPARRPLLDHVEGRLLIDRAPAEGEALLAASIRASDALPDWNVEGRKARAYSYSVLTLAAARRGDAARAMALLAAESGLPAPRRCALGVAVEDRLRMVVVRGPDGSDSLHFDADRDTPAIDPAALVPRAFIGKLDGCPVVDVLARSPVHGLPRLLPDALAWRYRAPRSRALAAALPALTAHRLVVADAQPPAQLELPRLSSWGGDGGGRRLAGADATPTRVLAAIRDATEIELHAHGMVNLGQPDASFLALSEEPGGRFALTAGDVRVATLNGAPLVVLAACHAARGAATIHEPWSLPAAFVFAGARAVVAPAAPVPDGDAAAFFADLRARVERGDDAALALRDARLAWLGAGRAAWVRDLIVFE